MSITLSITRLEANLMLRRYANMGWLAFPVAVAIAFGFIPAASDPIEAWGGNTAIEVYHAPLVVLCPILMSLMVLPEDVASYREIGYLRRLRATPMHPGSLLVARAALTLILQFVAAAAVVLIPLLTGAAGVDNPLGLIASFAALSVALLGLGMLVAGIVPNRGTATIVNTILFVFLALFAGMWLPRAVMPTWLLNIAEWSPTGAGAEAIETSLIEGVPAPSDFFVMLGWGAIFILLALFTFRWDERRQ